MPFERRMLLNFLETNELLTEHEFLSVYTQPFIIIDRQNLFDADPKEFFTSTDYRKEPGKCPKTDKLVDHPDLLIWNTDFEPFLYYLDPGAAPNGGFVITVGRDCENDITLPSGGISKFHAFFEPSMEKWSIHDHRSTNGTFVNGEPLNDTTPSKELSGGEEIDFGGICRTVFHTPETIFQSLLVDQGSKG